MADRVPHGEKVQGKEKRSTYKMPCSSSAAAGKGGPKTARMETAYTCVCECDCDNKVSTKGAVCDECKD